MITITPQMAIDTLKFEVPRKRPVMFTGAPGIGKTSISQRFGLDFVGRILFQHPGIQEPTDVKGLPWFYQENGMPKADFIAFNDFETILTSSEPLLVICDDFGQGTNAVQAAWMPVFLDRMVSNKPIPETVSFVVCTNRRQDRANVSGVLLPIRSRMLGGIYELTISVRDWCIWALKEKLPTSLVQFIRWAESNRENKLLDPNPPREIEGYFCPRTVAEVGYAQKDGLPESLYYTNFSGKCGEGWATEYCAFLEIHKSLPSFETIVAFPDDASIPDIHSSTGTSALFAVCGKLAYSATEDNFGNILRYAMRLPEEFTAMLVEDALEANPLLAATAGYVNYLSKTKASRQAVGLS